MKPIVTVILLMGVLGGLLCVHAESEEAPLFLFRGVRPMTLGNAFEALADDANALHYNPAGVAQQESVLVDLLLLRTRVSVDLANERSEAWDLFDAIDTLAKSDHPLDDPDPVMREAREIIADDLERLVQEELAGLLDLPSISVLFPITEIGPAQLSLGLSFYTQANTTIDVFERGLAWSDPVKAMLDDELFYRVVAQWSIAGSIAARIPLSLPMLSEVSAGWTLRRLHRQVFTDEDDLLTIQDVLKDPEHFAENYFGFEEGQSFLDFARNNFDAQTGYSTDLGILVVPLDGFRVGLSIRNLTSSLQFKDIDRDLLFPRNVVLSSAVKPFELLGLDNGWADLTVAASLDDPKGDDTLSEFSSNNMENLHFGLEVVLWPEGPFSLAGRLGSNQGFLTVGVGIRLGPIEAQVGRYGDLQSDWYVASAGLIF